ncbi:c-type cytochrome [Methylophaga sp. OBS3]|uniref:c-type cytochrome n=1 Tax=Methylophaga sp. OBS3 TaxID=2991934 RepID=UPI00224ECE7C|nr:cytochrome c [Methylophaga sp. OBS3]MCX4189200.1 cytochrome c [Methylophaga sp. OBS3]
MVNTNLNRLKILIGVSLFALSVSGAHAQVQPYTVKNGNQVDADTFKGYTLYRNWCARCHGTFGQGLAGPNLAESLNKITYETFLEVVAKGKMGQIGMMPAWSGNPQVMKGREDIYRYLKARADGAIGPVKPEKAQ